MAQQSIGTNWDRDSRNAMEGNFNELYGVIGDFVGTVSEEVYERIIEGSKLTWREPVDSLSGLPASASEGDTRMARDTGKVYRFDGAAWKEIQQIDAGPVNEVDTRLTQQLEDNREYSNLLSDKAFYQGLGNHRDVKPMMAIIDDDISSAVWDQLKSVLEQERVPITLAAITGQVGNPGRLSREQMKVLHELGAEYASHTENHLNLRDLTPKEQEEEMSNSKNWLRDNGFESDVIVYPYGGADNETRDIARRYYSAGVDIDRDSSLNNPPINTYMLQRVYLNDVGSMNVQLAKDKIDETKQNNSLMILGMHCHYAGFSKAGLTETIQYAKTQGVEIVSMREVLEAYSNIIDIPDIQIGADGSTSPYSIIGKYRRQAQIFQSNAHVDNYAMDAVSYRPYTGIQATANAMPENRAGVLFTYRLASDDYAFRTYVVIQTRTEYRSFWDNVGKKWSPWTRLISQQFFKDQLIAHGTLNAGETKDYTIPSSAFQFTRPGNANPKSALPLGIMYSYFVQSAGVGAVRLYNTTSSPINVGSIEWRAFTLEQ